MGRILSEEGMARHPILAYLKQGGMPHSESDMPTPYVHIVRHFNYNSGKLELPPIHHADVLIHPFSVGNADLRMMPLEKYERVFERLAEHRGDLTIGVLGMGHDAVPWRSLRQREDVVIKYLYGYHLQEVIRMMCAANVLLTADSGMNRLAAIAHYDRHIILRPESYPEYWVTHPGAICIGGTPATWDPDQIADTMIAVMEKKEQPV
jgi:hypothetical protein